MYIQILDMLISNSNNSNDKILEVVEKYYESNNITQEEYEEYKKILETRETT